MINQIDNLLAVSETTYKVTRETLKIARIVTLIVWNLALIVWIVAKDLARQQVEASLKEAPKVIEPTSELKRLMPAQEFIRLAEVVDVEDLDTEELRWILKANKVKGWNFIKKEETLRAKVLALG